MAIAHLLMKFLYFLYHEYSNLCADEGIEAFYKQKEAVDRFVGVHGNAVDVCMLHNMLVEHGCFEYAVWANNPVSQGTGEMPPIAIRSFLGGKHVTVRLPEIRQALPGSALTKANCATSTYHCGALSVQMAAGRTLHACVFRGW